jgi:fermentation-respiration switch protein FrsA (DUF1100 family)
LAGFFGIVIVVIAAFLAFLWLVQRRLIYFPFPSQVPGVEQVLAGAEEVSFETGDGLRLNGWFLPSAAAGIERSPGGPDGGPTAPATGWPAVLVFNGNAGNRSMRVPLARALSGAGWSVLLFDYRGYGGNPGSPTETGLMADARAAREYLARRSDVDPARIAYFGESLGAAVAIGLAVETPPVAIILRSPFTSLADVAAIHYPFLPARLLLADRYPSIERIGRIRVPKLFLAGDRDGLIPAELTRRLFGAAEDPKEMVLIPGADHNDFDLLAGNRLMTAIVAFLAATGPEARRPRIGGGGGVFS